MDKPESKANVFAGVFYGLSSLIAVIAAIVGILFHFAFKGQVWAIITLTIVAVLFVGITFNGVLIGFMFANQKQDERLMAAQQRMFTTNAMENLQLMEQTQKIALLTQRQQTEVARLEKVRSGIAIVDDTGSDSYLIPSSELYQHLQEQRS